MCWEQSLESDGSDLEDVIVDDIDPESLLGHLFLTSNLHCIPVDYPPHFYTVAKSMNSTLGLGGMFALLAIMLTSKSQCSVLL